MPSAFRLDGSTACLQHQFVEALVVEFLPDFYEVAVGPRHQTVEHLDDINAVRPRAEYTVAIPSPMMPPPITSMRFGTSLSSSGRRSN